MTEVRINASEHHRREHALRTRLKEVIEDHAIWAHPLHHWSCDAIVGAAFLEALGNLARHAPPDEIAAFIKKFQG